MCLCGLVFIDPMNVLFYLKVILTSSYRCLPQCYLSDSISTAVGKEVHGAVTLPGKEETVFQFVAHLKRDQSQYVME